MIYNQVLIGSSSELNQYGVYLYMQFKTNLLAPKNSVYVNPIEELFILGSLPNCISNFENKKLLEPIIPYDR